MELVAVEDSEFDRIERERLSAVGLQRSVERAFANHSYWIHYARLLAIRTLLPPAETIIDLGGAAAPLYEMGYAHAFKKLTMIDLPPHARHQMYASISARPAPCGNVLVHYADMTRLDSFADRSVDLVWSGQSIEHVPLEAGTRMIAEAFRVLKPGGYFCLDTPNGLITSVHAATAGKTMIHDEHHIEYRPNHLQSLLTGAGFSISKAMGVRHMPRTVATKTFDYSDFVLGSPLWPDIVTSYIQFYCCRRNK